MASSRLSARAPIAPLVLTAALALLGACAALAPRGGGVPGALGRYGWLLGTWHGTGGREDFFERYEVRDDSTFAIVYFTDSTRTATQPVVGTVEARGGRIYHTYGRSRWVVAEGSPTTLLFHPVERAGNRFRWTRESPTRWTAVLMQPDSLGRETTRSYTLTRLDAPGRE